MNRLDKAAEWMKSKPVQRCIKILSAVASDALARLQPHPAGDEFTTLVMERKDNGATNWSVEFE